MRIFLAKEQTVRNFKEFDEKFKFHTKTSKVCFQKSQKPQSSKIPKSNFQQLKTFKRISIDLTQTTSHKLSTRKIPEKIEINTIS